MVTPDPRRVQAQTFVDEIWRAYVPYARGRDTSRDLPAMLAMLALGRAVSVDSMDIDGRHAPEREIWDRAVGELDARVSPWNYLTLAMHALADGPRHFVHPDAFTSVTGLTDQDVPWAADVLKVLARHYRRQHSAIDQEPTSDLVLDLIVERAVRSGTLDIGEYFTPAALCTLAVELTAPGDYERILDPVCGFGGFLIAAARHGVSQNVGSLSLRAYAINEGSRQIAAAGFSMHEIVVDLRHRPGPDFATMGASPEKANVILANPPFNQRIRTKEKPKWKYGTPPESSADFAWLQYGLSTLTGTGRGAMVMPPRAAWSTNGQEVQIRRNMVADRAVVCVIALPPHLFARTGIAPHLWITTADRAGLSPARIDEMLFIDARELGVLSGRTNRVLTEGNLQRITDSYRNWLSGHPRDYKDEPGFCNSVPIREILADDHSSLDPGRYVRPARLAAPRDDKTSEQLLADLERTDMAAARLRTTLRVETSEAALESAFGPQPEYRALHEISGPSTFELRRVEILSGPSGSLLKASEYLDDEEAGGVPVIMPRDLGDNRFHPERAGRVSPAKARKLERFALWRGDIVVARRGDIGRRAFVTDAQHGWIFGTGCLVIRPHGAIDSDYLAAYLGRPEVREWLSQHATATATLASISAEALGRLPVCVPNQATQAAIGKAMARVIEHEQLLQQASSHMSKLRETVFTELLGAALEL